MSKKICFSAMLQEKKEQQKRAQLSIKSLPSLGQIMEEYIEFPYEQFTLRLGQPSSMSQFYSQENTYQMGVDPLEAWLNNHAHNKENISDAPQRRPPKDLEKYKKLSKQSNDSDFNDKRSAARTSNQNIAMKDLCKKFVEDKNSKINKKQQLVWKFGSKVNSSVEQDMIQSTTSSKQQPLAFRQNYQSKAAQKKQNKNVRNNDQPLADKISERRQVQKIANILKDDIQTMAMKMIEDKQEERSENEEDQQILISQKQNNNRVERAQREILEYLQLKKAENEKQNSLSKKNKQQQPECCNSPVGYSFSSDFNSQIKNEQSKVNEDISLPNIDEVYSEKDQLQKHQMHNEIIESAKKVKVRESRIPQIDKNCIQQIQSVAYQPPKTENHIEIKQSIQEMKEEQSVNASLPMSQQEKIVSQNPSKELEKLGSVKALGSLYISGPNKLDFKKVCSPSKKQSIIQRQNSTKNFDYKIEREDSIKELNSNQRHETTYVNENSTNSLLKMSKKSSGSSKGYKISPPNNEQPKKMIKITLSPNFNPQNQREETTVNIFNGSNGRKMMGSRQESMKSIGENAAKSNQFQFDLDF